MYKRQILAGMALGTSHTLVAVRALVEAGDRASARTRAEAEGDPTWRAVLGVCFANALPEGDPEGDRALAEAVAFGGSPDDIVAMDIGDPALLAASRRDRALLDPRAESRLGARPARPAILNAAPKPMELLQALQRRWLLALTLLSLIHI